MDAVKDGLDEYKKEWSKDVVDLQRCASLMTALRVQSATLSLANPKEAYLLREVLEHAVLLHLRRNDTAAMERAMASLRVLYYDHARVLPPSPRAHTLLGVYLLYLLTENRLADLHAELELMDDDARSSRYVKFVVALEQHKMEGRFHKLWAMQRDELPHELFSPHMKRLLDTARADIGSSLEGAYSSLRVEHARQLLGLESPSATLEFARNRAWRLDSDVLILRDAGANASPHLNALQLISQSLAYANEMERII